jgi:hypothetical protein
MYRASHETLLSKIEHLEAELHDLRALRAPARPGERLLWAVTATSVLGAVLAFAACASARAHGADVERRFDGARVRLEQKTQDLASCESFALRELRGEAD